MDKRICAGVALLHRADFFSLRTMPLADLCDKPVCARATSAQEGRARHSKVVEKAFETAAFEVSPLCSHLLYEVLEKPAML
jgi:hypothetical protein